MMSVYVSMSYSIFSTIITISVSRIYVCMFNLLSPLHTYMIIIHTYHI